MLSSPTPVGRNVCAPTVASGASHEGKHAYDCYGFRILSDVPIRWLDGVTDIPPAVGDLHVEVTRSEGMQFDGLPTGYGLPRPGTISLHLPHIGTFLIEDGRKIRVFPTPHAGADDIRPYLLGSAIGAAMHQRGMVALHASSVRTERGVVAFAAPCGFGKSTIAAGMWRRGFSMLSDDILALKEIPEGSFVCLRGAPAFKLLPDAAQRLEPATVAQKELNEETGKYYVSVDRPGSANAPPLWRIYFLKDGDQIRIRELTGIEGLGYVVSNIFRPELIELLSAQRRLLPQLGSLLATTRCFSLERPANGDPDSVCRAVERHIAGCD